MFDGRETQVLAASLAIVGVFVFLRWMRQKAAADAGKRYPPSLSLVKLAGSILRGGMTGLPEHFRKTAEELGPIFSFKAGKSMVVMLNGYETIVNAFSRQSEVYADRFPLWIEKEILNPELRGIIFIRYGDLFKKYHKISLSILKEFGFGQDRVTETRILQEVETISKEILKHDGRPFDPKWPFIFATSDVILNILFGTHFQKFLPEDYSAIVRNSIACVSNMDHTLNLAPFVRILPAYRRMVDTLRTSSKSLLKSIEAGIEFIKSDNSEATFVGRFLEIEGSNYDQRDLVYVLRDLCFAGTDTVATTLEWLMVELANHPEVLARFQSEIDEMIPRYRLPSLDDKLRMPYTEALILEIMRRHTIAPLLVPHATTRDVQLLEFDLPKGCMVIGNVVSAHMDSSFWKDPESFRPERFLDSDNNVINSDKVISFGIGKRACLGEILARQNIFLFLTSLVQRFDIRPPEGQDRINVKEVTAIATAPTPFEVRLIPRVKPTPG